jgi:formylglycine-generating enzyme required for sulfatase activity
VTVPSFWLGRTEITQEQWMAVMGGNPSKFLDCDDCPVENVSWNDVQEYLRRLNAKTGKEYRLPSEAEWEYACRAGSPGIYCGGNDIDRIAWTDSEGGSASQPHTVAQKQPNAFGLHDMCGNVWEWVQDCWNAGYAGAPTDGSAWTTGDCSRRGLRGGSWGFEPSDSRATSRFKNKAGLRNFYLGFRVAHSRPAAARP